MKAVGLELQFRKCLRLVMQGRGIDLAFHLSLAERKLTPIPAPSG